MHSLVSDMIDYNKMLGKEFELILTPINVIEDIHIFKVEDLLKEVMSLF
jgi:hypothetical protein